MYTCTLIFERNNLTPYMVVCYERKGLWFLYSYESHLVLEDVIEKGRRPLGQQTLLRLVGFK